MLHANLLERLVDDQNFAEFAFKSVRMKTFKTKYDELISRASPRVHALLGDRYAYTPLASQANAAGMVFTAPDFQMSSVGVKCLDEVDRHIRSGFWDSRPSQAELCGMDELLLDELRKSGVRRIGIFYPSGFFSEENSAEGQNWGRVRFLRSYTA